VAKVKPGKKLKDRRLLFLRHALAGLQGGRLCYGDPVRNGDRVVVPVARVSTAVGGGFGSGRPQEGGGGGGGGWVEAAPVGFIDVGPDGARFQPIPDPVGTARGVRNVIGGVTALAGVIAGAKALKQQQRMRQRGLLSPRRLLHR
jgi:uncharacterized spore protein YtfJ